MVSPTRLPVWQKLAEHQQVLQNLHLRDQFAQDPQRFRKFSRRCGDLLCDFSKNRITDETFGLLMELAAASGLSELRRQMFAGEVVNVTEERAVAHWALRRGGAQPQRVRGMDVAPDVQGVLERMRAFSAAVRDGRQRGATGKPFRAVVAIGIGGSHLGPALVCEALQPYARRDLDVHFVSNVDGSQLAETLRLLSPETTLFVVASKSFTTQETLTNARTARQWLVQKLGTESAVTTHFAAISTNRAKTAEFGIGAHRVFEFWDWVGGRYSLWSSIGLSVALAVGMERFDELLAGAAEMDEHFRIAPFEDNLPVILGLLGVWYTDFFGFQSHAVVPYDYYLRSLPAYLQQVDMESNGKSVNRQGESVDCSTGPVVWGAPGTDGQHAFFQHLHQSPQITPVDFLAAVHSHNPLGDHQRLLLANCLAQSEALMQGRSARIQGSGPQARASAVHRAFSGNRPSNTLIYPKLTPRMLGTLLALYEHKVFVQGAVWNINSFDQFGVELGKILADRIASELLPGATAEKHDSSTQGLIEYCKSTTG